MSILAKTTLTICVRAAFAVLRLTVDTVVKWIEYCVLNASIKVLPCTFEFTAIVIDKSAYGTNQLLQATYLDNLQLHLAITIIGTSADGLNDRIDQQSWLPTIHLGGLLALRVKAVVLAVAV